MPITTAPQKLRQAPISLSSYHTLCSKLQKIFFAGQQKINQAKAETYWKAGKTINDLVDRAHTPYLAKGKHVVAGLAEDLRMEADLLYRCMQFAQKFPHFATSRNVDWSHYVELIPIEDAIVRTKLLDQTSKENWPVKKLREEILKGRKDEKMTRRNTFKTSLRPSSNRPSFLKPRLGKLHTYRVISRQEFGFEDNGERLLDHGFRFFSPVTKGYKALLKDTKSYAQPVVTNRNLVVTPRNLKEEFKTNSIIEMEGEKLTLSSRTDQDRYFYSAKVEKGIDGDTFWAVIDCGLGQTTEQKLRLRGINAAEAGQYGAKKATQFLNALLPPGSEILLKTSKSPNHDRFVADVYVSKEIVESRKERVEKIQKIFSPSPAALFVSIENQDHVFVNNLLLALGLAKIEPK